MYRLITVIILSLILISSGGCLRFLKNIFNRNECVTTLDKPVKYNEEGSNVIVVVGSKNCPACKVLIRKIENAPKRLQKKLDKMQDRLYYIDGDRQENKKMMLDLNIQAYPTIIKLKVEKGKLKEIQRFVGANISYDKLELFIQ